jgi:hypothetical protein
MGAQQEGTGTQWDTGDIGNTRSTAGYRAQGAQQSTGNTAEQEHSRAQETLQDTGGHKKHSRTGNIG